MEEPLSIRNEIIDDLIALDLYYEAITDNYYYENGRLSVIESRDDIRNTVIAKHVFRYYDNMRICEDYGIDRESKVETRSDNVNVEIYADGRMIEFFSITMGLPHSEYIE